MRYDTPTRRNVRTAVLVVLCTVTTWIANGCWNSMKDWKRYMAGREFSILPMALRMYAQDYDERLPLMQDHESLKRALMPYVRYESAFINDADPTVLYLPNPSLSFRKLSDITVPETVSLYESKPARNGKRWVVFVREDAPYDPNAPYYGDNDFAGLKLVDKAEWRTLKRLSHIP